MRELHIDLETYSSVDLKKCGVHKYVESVDFEIMICAWAFDDGPVHVTDQGVPPHVAEALVDPNVLKFAHNAPFEMACLGVELGVDLDPKQWRCTAVIASELGLPRDLYNLSIVMKLPQNKAKMGIGRSLISYFCKPCKPTKANGGRHRNLPHHAPDRWAEFMDYCRQDVEAEREVHNLLRRVWIDEDEWDIWATDQRINRLGAMADMAFVRKAQEIGAQMQTALMAEARRLTRLTNPNSVKQLTAWLSKETGDEVEDLKKDSVKAMLATSDDDTVTRVLEIRQQLGKTSVKKYAALENAVCADGRLRGTLLFYGASRTGRWAGRIFQPQNLPQNKMKDIEAVRDIVLKADFSLMEMLYDNGVADILSQLIRTAIVPRPGKKLIVCDYSAVEARMLAWLADEEWRLEVFRTHGKIYEASASAAFHVPIEQIGKDSPLRQQGKVLELACVAEGTMVATSNGLKPIENVRSDDMVWDGVEWVHHDGVICRGYKEVITYEGLTATSDHLVWIEGKCEPVELRYAAACGAHLLRTGNCGKAIRVGEDNQPREAMEQNNEPLQGARSMSRLFKGILGHLQQFNKGCFQWVSGLFSKESHTERLGQKAYCSQAEVHEPERQGLQELWCERHTVRFPLGHGGRAVGPGVPGRTTTGYGARQDRQQRSLRPWKSAVGDQEAKQLQQANLGNGPLESQRVALLKNRCHEKAQCGYDKRRNSCGCSKGCCGEAQELAGNRKMVYDILNAGPRHRFTAADVLVHNCGYGGSAGAIEAMDYNKAIPEADRKPMVQAWRAASPNIVKLWWAMGEAALNAVENPGVRYSVKKGISFLVEKGFLFMTLPSGRRLAYPRPRIEEGKYGPQVTYEGINQYTNKWGRISTYGPKLVENLCQAACRDLLGYGMRQVPYDIVLHVHDEAVIECDLDVDVHEVEALLARKPDWAGDMPHVADGFETFFYKK